MFNSFFQVAAQLLLFTQCSPMRTLYSRVYFVQVSKKFRIYCKVELQQLYGVLHLHFLKWILFQGQYFGFGVKFLFLSMCHHFLCVCSLSYLDSSVKQGQEQCSTEIENLVYAACIKLLWHKFYLMLKYITAVLESRKEVLSSNTWNLRLHN